jgi:DNA-binding response OmpR family regulator
VIIVSSRDTHDDISLGYTIGADDYLTKPFDPSDLIRRVRWQLMANGS